MRLPNFATAGISADKCLMLSDRLHALHAGTSLVDIVHPLFAIQDATVCSAEYVQADQFLIKCTKDSNTYFIAIHAVDQAANGTYGTISVTQHNPFDENLCSFPILVYK